MTPMINYFLLLYFILFFGIAFLGISYVVSRKIKKNPMAFPRDDSAYGLVGLYFKYTLIGLFGYVVARLFVSNNTAVFMPIPYLEYVWLQYAGIGLMILTFIWVVIAQLQMSDSWRIGIDTDTKTELVTKGLFSVSRNPIFLGMICSLLGLFLVAPNMFTLLFLVVGYILIQIQIRLEETFLTQEHGEAYQQYILHTKRLL